MKMHPITLPKQPHIQRTLIAAAVSISLIPTVRADYASEILSENPLVYYRFNDSVVTDDAPTPEVNLGSLGAPGNATLSDSFVRQVTGALTGSPDVAGGFAGTGASIPYHAALNNQGSFSVEVWLKPSVIPAAAALVCPISSWRENPAEATGREGWLIYQGDAATGFNFRTYNKNAANVAVNINSGTGVTAGVWQHVAVTWNNASAVAKIYVNGVLKNTSAPVVPTPPLRAYEANTVSPFTIGSRSDGSFAWTGNADEPAYYSTVLTDTQILNHYNNGISAAPSPSYNTLVLADAPVGYWRLNNSFVFRTPPAAANSGLLGAAATGGYHAGAKTTSTGPSPSTGFGGFGAGNSALSLTNGNGYVSSALGLLNNRTAFTVTGWVKRGSIHSTRGGYFGQNDLLEFGDSNNGTSIETFINAGGSLSATYTAADDVWQFIALTANGTKNILYIDGVQVAEAAAAVTNFGSSASNFNIGGGGIFAPTGDYFRGEIDEVAVFDKAVTPGRVRQFFDAAVGNVEPGIVNQIPEVSPTGTIREGQPYTLSVDATGTPPFTYQWLLNGQPISGATGKNYTVPAAAANTPDTSVPYSYSVRVTHGTSTVTSEPIDVFVTPILKWASPAGTNSGKWDIDMLTPSPLNWKTYTTSAAKAYSDAYAVVFDDTATSTNVELTQDVYPVAVAFNNSTKNYTFTGPFAIRTVYPSITTKSGTGTVVLANDLYESETMEVTAGKLQIGNGSSGALGASTLAKVLGGELAINLANESVYGNATTVTSGLVSFKGTGNLTVTGVLSGAGDMLFDRNGIVTLSTAATATGALNISSGTLSLDGSQNFNRLPNNKVITVNPGATLEVRGVNALPSAANAVLPTLHQATLRVFSGGSTAIGTGGTSHTHLKTLTLDGSAVILDYSGQGGAYNGESFQLNGDLIVTGSAASTISFGTGATTGNAGISLSTDVTHTFAVPDIAVGPDLTITAELENNDSITPTAGLIEKTGAGTLSLEGGIAHSFSGTTRVSEGTLQANGSIVGPLEILGTSVLAPGPSTANFSAGEVALQGTYSCEISGAASDRLLANGDVTFAAGAKINLSVTGGATAPFYEILRSTGTISGTPIVTGIPSGYSVTVSSSSVLIARSDINIQPMITSNVPTGSENFDTTRGGFSVSTPVSPETDWTYTAGSWHSTGQINGTAGDDNTSYLISPIYTVTQTGPVTLSFTHRYSFEADFDGGAVDVSINGGAFTQVPLAAFSQNPYNGAVPAGVTHSLVGHDAFVGNSTGHPSFITSICTLANGVVGNTIQVRFASASDNNTVGNLSPAGWEVDSFVITGALPNLMTLTWPVGIMQYSDNLQPPWTDISGSSPLLIDTKVAPKRFFRLKP